MNFVLNPDAPEFHPHFNAHVQDGYLQTNKAIRTSNTFPIGTSYQLFKTFTDFNEVTCKLRENVTIQSNQIMAKEVSSVKLKCNGDDETNTEKIIDANDSFLDRININIDNVNGVNAPSAEFLSGVKTAAWNRTPVIATIKVNGGEASLISARNIPRPQLSFKDPVDNSDDIFTPRIRTKPNSIKPLSLNLVYDDEGLPIGYAHPYAVELEHYTPPKEFLTPGEEQVLPPPVSETPFTMVDTPQALDQLVYHLGQVKAIAVDLEHHSYRTYQGITCLIQITTDEGGDFIVDALALRDQLYKLNFSFTDPTKIKVFHGADNDILWLQRDFGVYVVGLFDTHQAALLLRFPSLSLKYLLQRYCRLDIDKTYQLADWRIRPLPTELVQYARTDTHYLLYVWRAMRSALVNSYSVPPTLIYTVFHNSQLVCAKTYTKERLTNESHMPLYLRSKKRFNAAQMTALRMLYRWRDQQAREMDESTTYLLPNHMLLALADTLPREMQGIHAICCPMPPFVKQNLFTLHNMILSCREVPEEPQLFQMPQAVLGMAVPPHTQRQAVHDLATFLYLSDNETDVDPWSEAADKPEDVHTVDCGNESGWEADLIELDETAELAPLPVSADLHYLKHTSKSHLNAEAQLFVPPYDRYRIYRAISQADELKQLKQKEARVAAISNGNKLIRDEVLEPLYRSRATRADEQVAERSTQQDAAQDSHSPPDAPEQDSLQKRAVRRKRNDTNKNDSEEKNDPEQTVRNKKKVQKKESNKNEAGASAFSYRNANYSKFHSENEKRHIQPKSKQKKS